MKPDRTTLLFLGFLLVIGVLFGLNFLVTRQEPEAIAVVVDPLAESWVRAAAAEYNASNPIINNTTRVRVDIASINDLDVWRDGVSWSAMDHPAAWVPSSSLSVEYSSLPLAVVAESLARTPLVWGGFANRVAVITQDGERPFEWEAVQQTAGAQTWSALGASGGNVNMAIHWPSSSMAGVGVLLSAAANVEGTDIVQRAFVRSTEFTTWFDPIRASVVNSQRMGGDPAQVLASRGTAQGDFGLLPEANWLSNLSGLTNDGFVFAYPAYQFVLDFPLLRWDDARVTSFEEAAVRDFAAFLLGERGQALALEAGLRPADSEPTEDAALFTAAQAYGIELEPDYGLAVLPESREAINALLRLLEP